MLQPFNGLRNAWHVKFLNCCVLWAVARLHHTSQEMSWCQLEVLTLLLLLPGAGRPSAACDAVRAGVGLGLSASASCIAPVSLMPLRVARIFSNDPQVGWQLQ
jgi:hypothetical protein